MLVMTPSQYRAGGTNEEIKFAVGQTSLGAILVASSKKGVAAILLGTDPDELVRNLQDRFAKARLVGADHDYEALIARIVGFIEAPRIGLDLPLDVRGTAFQQRVWQALRVDGMLYRDRTAYRLPPGSACGRRCVCREQSRHRHPLPPGGPQRRRTVGICLGRGTQARSTRPGDHQKGVITPFNRPAPCTICLISWRPLRHRKRS